MKRHKKITRTPGEWVLDIVKVVFLAFVVVVTVYPFWNIFIISINDATDAIRGGLYFLPRKLSLSSYAEILRRSTFLASIKVSVARTLIGTPIAVLVTAMLAYPLSRKDLVGRKFWNLLFVFTMYFGGGLVPYYITMKAYHLNNTFWLYIIPGIVNAYYVILIKTFIEQIPQSLQESAELDGAGFFKIYTSIILPLSKPILATVAVYASVGAWNSWQDNYLLVQNPNLQTVQLILYNCINQAQMLADSMRSGQVGNAAAISLSADSVRMATTIITVIPVMLVYPFLQKYFVKGVMLGAVKG